MLAQHNGFQLRRKSFLRRTGNFGLYVSVIHFSPLKYDRLSACRGGRTGDRLVSLSYIIGSRVVAKV